MNQTGPGASKRRVVGTDDPTAPILRVGAFLIDRNTRVLSRDGRRVDIQRLPLDVLIYLAERHQRVVSRDELVAAFWPRAGSDEALTRCVSTLRKVLGDTGEVPRYVETIWGEGYRCIAPVAADVAMPRTTSTRQSSTSRRWLPTVLLVLVVILAVALLAQRPLDRQPPPAVQAMAVLPIAAAGGEDWIATTMTDHLVDTVSRIEGLRVVARGSTAGFGPDADPVQLGRQLGVDAVLASRLVEAGGATRLTSRLLSTDDGSVLWTYRASPTPGGEERQVVELADAIARRLWANLQLREAETRVDAAAYRHYLRGRYYWNQRSADSLAAAIESFESALDRQPDYVDALVGLADTWLLMPLYGAMPPAQAIPRAREAAERVLEIDPERAHAHAVIGVIAMQYDWEWNTAETHLRRAVTLNPNDATAIQWLGELYCYRRLFDQCARHYRQARGLDPLSPIIRMVQGSPALYAGDYPAAVAAYREVLEQIPDFRFTLVGLGHAYVGQGAWGEAIATYEAALPELGLAIAGGPLAHALGRDSQNKRARALLAELEVLARERYVPPTRIAIAHIGLDNHVAAVDALHEAVAARDERLVYLAVDPFYRPLHGDPEFRAIAAKIGLLDVLAAD